VSQIFCAFVWIYGFQGEHWMAALIPRKTQYLSQNNKWRRVQCIYKCYHFVERRTVKRRGSLVRDEGVYNADKTVFVFESTPNKTLAFKGEQ
jgi:hypothetical protein